MDAQLSLHGYEWSHAICALTGIAANRVGTDLSSHSRVFHRLNLKFTAGGSPRALPSTKPCNNFLRCFLVLALTNCLPSKVGFRIRLVRDNAGS